MPWRSLNSCPSSLFSYPKMSVPLAVQKYLFNILPACTRGEADPREDCLAKYEKWCRNVVRMAALSRCRRVAGTHTATSRCLSCSPDPFLLLRVTVRVLKEIAASPAPEVLALPHSQGNRAGVTREIDPGGCRKNQLLGTCR